MAKLTLNCVINTYQVDNEKVILEDIQSDEHHVADIEFDGETYMVSVYMLPNNDYLEHEILSVT